MRKRGFSKKQILTLRRVLADRPRDLALLNLGVDTALRGGDLLRLKVKDVITEWGEVRETLSVMTHKNRNKVECLLTENSQTAVERWVRVSKKEKDDYLFTSLRGGTEPIKTLQFRRIVKGWCEECSWDSAFFSGHSLRRTTPAYLYSQTKDLRAAQIILGHKNISNTAFYLNIEQEDAFELLKKNRI